MRFLLPLLIIQLYSFSQNSLPAIGSWREHLPYGNTIDVTASQKKVYTATPYSLFSIEFESKEVERMSRVSGLNETGISTIKFDLSSNKLFIAYTNSNIDIIDDKGINNIPGLKRESIQGDKKIYHFFPDKDVCYVSAGIGIIVLNTVKYEIKQAWVIGNGGGYVRVNMFTKDKDFFYAATAEGLKRTAVNSSNPADFRSWQILSGINGLPAGECNGVVNLQDKIIAWQNDSLFIQSGAGWNFFFTNGQPITSINVTENVLTVCQKNRVTILNKNGQAEKIIQGANIINDPRQAILQNGNIWIADSVHALSQWRGNSLVEQFNLNAPKSIATGEIVFYNSVFYAAAGSVDENWKNQNNTNGFYKYADGKWTNFNKTNRSLPDSLNDFITIAIDPRDESIWAGSYGGGLLHLKNNNPIVYKQASPIGTAINDPGSYRVSGLAFDPENNLWITNYGASQNLHVLKRDNTWKSFSAPFSLSENAVSQILIDDFDQKWIVSPKGGGLLSFNHGTSVENTIDDKWRLFTSGSGRGNLPSSNVLAIAKDKNGYIWVGTTDGIGVIQCPQDVFTSGCEAILPVAEQGGFGNYLFKGEHVQSIAVDGADRTWVGTRNGVWLINGEGDRIIEHFTEENSSLLSNDVKRIAVNGKNGEVFFATAKGICSFRGTATEGLEATENLLVYPNPVPPNYTGTIAIRGLALNSFVKITELNGRLVFQTKALGGQAIWDGKNYKGQKIASGVYLIMIMEEGKNEKAAGKVVFIN